MLREPQIPLFLWIASAVLAHLAFAGGADRASALIEQRAELRKYAALVQRHVAEENATVEVALLDEQALAPEHEPEPEPAELEQAKAEADEPEVPAAEPTQVQPEPAAQKHAKPRPPEPPKPKEKEKEKEPSVEPKPPQVLELRRDRRIAVRQHVKDKNQEDNPDAEFIGDEANRVEEQTQARITSTDRDDPNPTPGGQHLGPGDQPGNSDRTRVGQSDDAPGDPDRTPTPLPDARPPRVASVAPPPQPRRRGSAAPRREPLPRPRAAQPERKARAATKGVDAVQRRVTSPDGSWAASRERQARAARPGRKAHKGRKQRLPRHRRRPEDLLGLGASGRTDSGVSLNLTPRDAVAVVGEEQLRWERRADGERRRSEHRGSWRSLGIERWRSAIENYVPHVKPGNQTALNTARVPFASYLNAVHNRIHPVFADTFLPSLNSLPKNHPMNDMSISTNVEIVIDSADGSLVKMGVTKSSGVTAFDIGALEAVQQASPFGAPPKSIISPDGNVYLHWEFHRNPYYACSTYFARPYILKAKPKKTKPPQVEPPQRNPFRPEEGPPPSDRRRHG